MYFLWVFLNDKTTTVPVSNDTLDSMTTRKNVDYSMYINFVIDSDNVS